MARQLALTKVARGVYLGLQLGLLVTVAVLLGRQAVRRPQPSPLTPAAVPPPTAELKTKAPPPEPVQPTKLLDLGSADRLASEGRWEEARQSYDEIARLSARGVRITAMYRAAVCTEALGDYPGAETRYAALRAEVTDPTAAAVLLISQARCWLRMGMVDQSVQAAVDVLLQQSGELGDHPVVHEARYLLALAASRPAADQLATALGGDPLLKTAAAEPEWIPAYSLRWIQPVLLATGRPSVQSPADEFFQVERLGAGAADLRIDIFQRQIPVQELLEATAREGGVTIQLTAAAAERIREHRFRVHVRQALLSQLLGYLSVRLGLSWTADQDSRLTIRTTEELTGDARSTWRMSLAERLTREANVWLPNHPALSVAYLQLGLLYLAYQQHAQALAAFERALEEDSYKPAVIAAAFNAAIVSLLQRDYPAATKRLYFVVDAAPGSAIASRAHQLLGRTHLNRGQWPNAVSECRRALLTAPDRRQRALSALWLAMAYLFDENAAAAQQTLKRERRLLRSVPWTPLYRFLHAYTEYVQTTDPDRYLRTELLASVVEMPDFRHLGTPGIFLAGDAARRLGLEDLMRDLYEKHIDVLWPGRLADLIHQRLVEYYRDRGKYRLALEHLFAQSSHAGESGLVAAKVQQAVLYLEDGNYAKAIATARAALNDARDEETIRRLLGIMGEAYRRSGDHQRAALCFMGRLPLE